MLETEKKIDLNIPDLKIIRKIGEGGMSEVYLAEQISLKRKVAVKVMRMEVSSNKLDVERFKHEAETIAHLDHPNIIHIYNIGETEKGEAYFTMPYLNHGDFSTYLIEDEQEFINLLKSICDGLSYAHQRGVIHRDIKPENLLFGKFGNVNIADFGIAISKNGSRMTKEHQVVGSASYMSPEQVQSNTVGACSDIYSLGIVIYERLTGNVPFQGDENISILVGHVSQKPPNLPNRFWHWQKLIDKCLAKSPSDRFQSIEELKYELDKIPINSLQRTNLSIQHLLTDDMGHHFRWISISLLVVFFVILFIINQSTNAPNPVIVNQSIEPIKPKTNSTNFNDIEKESTLEEFPYDDLVAQTQSVDSVFVEEVNTLLDSAFNNIDNSQLNKPLSNNATDKFLQVLALAPDNVEAKKGLEYICEKYFELIDESLNQLEFNVALKHARSFILFNEKTKGISQHFSAHADKTIRSLDEIDLSNDKITADKIKTLTKIVKVFDDSHPLIDRFNEQAILKEGPQKGEKFIDNMGIETIVVNKAVAISPQEVTVEQYAKFVDETERKAHKCWHKGGGVSNFFNNKTWDNPYFTQDARHPVSCVTWNDAKAFTLWLTDQTQFHYRLPTKEEFLMLTQESITPFIACKSSNISGAESKKIRNKEDKLDCDDGHKFTAPVASFKVNSLGLYDINGNVSEWIECNQEPCETPIAMGTSWFHGTQSNTVDKYEEHEIDTAYSYVGFRVVRELSKHKTTG